MIDNVMELLVVLGFGDDCSVSKAWTARESRHQRNAKGD